MDNGSLCGGDGHEHHSNVAARRRLVRHLQLQHPCPCEFAQAPTNNTCLGILVWHVREGHFGDVRLDGFNLLAIGGFEGNIWAGAKTRLGLFIDERADERQRQALQSIFGGQAGGWPAGFFATIGDFRGVEFVPISFEIADDLAYWQAEVPGRIKGRAEALTGPTTPPGKRVQTINPPGSEVGPGQIATWGRSDDAEGEGFGFRFTAMSSRTPSGFIACPLSCVRERAPSRRQARDSVL